MIEGGGELLVWSASDYENFTAERPDLAPRALPGIEAGIVRRLDGGGVEEIPDPDVEGVIITTPNDTHKDVITAALEAGKAVYTDKPIARRGGAVTIEPNEATTVEIALESLRRGLLRVEAEVTRDDERRLAEGEPRQADALQGDGADAGRGAYAGVQARWDGDGEVARHAGGLAVAGVVLGYHLYMLRADGAVLAAAKPLDVLVVPPSDHFSCGAKRGRVTAVSRKT